MAQPTALFKVIIIEPLSYNFYPMHSYASQPLQKLS